MTADYAEETRRECAVWRCENGRKEGHEFCEDHPPLVSHGLEPNTAECPECGELGAGTIHDDLWYCLDEYGFVGCGALFDPYEASNTPKETKW